MNIEPPNIQTLLEVEQKHLGRFLRPVAVMLIVFGLAGVASPVLLSTLTVGITAAILIISGAMWAVHSLEMHSKSLGDWLRPVLLLVTGMVIVAEPAAGIASLGLLFTLYFLIDAYRNFTAHRAFNGLGRPWFIFSGILDILIALLFIATWPKGSLVLVGIFVGVNLIFDGIALLMLSRMAKPPKSS